MPSNKNQRLRKRAIKSRCSLSSSGLVRLSVHRTNQHIYASLVEAGTRQTLISVSSRVLQGGSSVSLNIETVHKRCVHAAAVGVAIAKKAADLGIHKVAFDRSGFAYHGRVKALAEAARGAGLQF